MNSNWRNRPTPVDFVPSNITYIVSIDENGTSNLQRVLDAKRNGKTLPDSERDFTVSACVIRTNDFPSAREQVMALKQKYWDDALFEYNGATKRVCFHSREIRGRKDAFHPSVIDYGAFILDLTQLIASLPMTIYASHIDKVRHVNRYIHPDSPYDLCMNFVLERILRDIGTNETCIVILESRGKREDKLLLDQIKELIDHGNRYHPASLFSKIKGVYFNPKWSKIDSEQKSYWSLEIADVCSYPIHKYFAHGTKDRAYEVVETKLKRYPHHMGVGLKSFP